MIRKLQVSLLIWTWAWAFEFELGLPFCLGQSLCPCFYYFYYYTIYFLFFFTSSLFLFFCFLFFLLFDYMITIQNKSKYKENGGKQPPTQEKQKWAKNDKKSKTENDEKPNETRFLPPILFHLLNSFEIFYGATYTQPKVKFFGVAFFWINMDLWWIIYIYRKQNS